MELTGEKKDWGRGMGEAFSMVKDQAPLVHMIANYVTASFCADVMAAMGARPPMAPGPEAMWEATGSGGGVGVGPGGRAGRKNTGRGWGPLAAGEMERDPGLGPVGGAGAGGGFVPFDKGQRAGCPGAGRPLGRGGRAPLWLPVRGRLSRRSRNDHGRPRG